jgi:ribose transport system ATP-binding protein
MDDLVSFDSLTKRFGYTEALGELSLNAASGSVHAITGENGAGKSTLMNLLAGVYQADSGVIRLRGRPVRFETPAQARRAGVSSIFQELTLLPNLTIEENLFLGREPSRAGLIDRASMRRKARTALDRVSIKADGAAFCAGLSVAEQQLVEIAKGLMAEADVFILDEPTAALNAPEVAILGGLIRSLRAEGKLVFYISHRLDEIFRFCDIVSVLKDGRHVATEAVGKLTHDRLISLMVGRTLGQLYPVRKVRSGPQIAALDIADLAVSRSGRTVSFSLNRGEILGLAGLQGQGQREIIRAVAGVKGRAGGAVTKRGPSGEAQCRLEPSIVDVALADVGFVPEDRKAEGLYLSLSVERNIALGALRKLSIWGRAYVKHPQLAALLNRMRVRAAGLSHPVASLSGGNQQKVMIGRWLAAGVDVLLIEEPTRGVDVGAKSEIYALLRDFADSGGAILVTSSELTEVLGLCDRILVVRGGSVVAELDGSTASEEEIMRHSLPGSPSANGALSSS